MLDNLQKEMRGSKMFGDPAPDIAVAHALYRAIQSEYLKKLPPKELKRPYVEIANTLPMHTRPSPSSYNTKQVLLAAASESKDLGKLTSALYGGNTSSANSTFGNYRGVSSLSYQTPIRSGGYSPNAGKVLLYGGTSPYR